MCGNPHHQTPPVHRLQSRWTGMSYIEEAHSKAKAREKQMKMDYIVSRIEASQDGSTYVYITYSDSDDFKADTDKTLPECPFGPNMTIITSPGDLMKNLPKAMANIGIGGISIDAPTFKISMREYEDLAIKVGDKVTIEIKKSDSSGI